MRLRRDSARAAFCVPWLGLLLAAGCSDEVAAPAPAPGPGPNDVSGVFSANHGHATWIREQDLLTGGELDLFPSAGSDGHFHEVLLTDQQVADIAAGQTTTVVSTSDGQPFHTHQVTFR